MSKVCIIGLGRQGTAAAYDLLLHSNLKELMLLDVNPTSIKTCLEKIKKVKPADVILKTKTLDLNNKIQFDTKDFNNFIPTTDKGTIIINPPYGERIGEQFDLNKLYKDLGDKFKKDCSGHNVFVFTGNFSLIKQIGLRTKRKMILKNGTIDCRLLYYPMQKGSFK